MRARWLERARARIHPFAVDLLADRSAARLAGPKRQTRLLKPRPAGESTASEIKIGPSANANRIRAPSEVHLLSLLRIAERERELQSDLSLAGAAAI